MLSKITQVISMLFGSMIIMSILKDFGVFHFDNVKPLLRSRQAASSSKMTVQPKSDKDILAEFGLSASTSSGKIPTTLSSSSVRVANTAIATDKQRERKLQGTGAVASITIATEKQKVRKLQGTGAVGCGSYSDGNSCNTNNDGQGNQCHWCSDQRRNGNQGCHSNTSIEYKFAPCNRWLCEDKLKPQKANLASCEHR